nr:DUF397 domain-containing protein [Streptomyces sp. NBC_00899]
MELAINDHITATDLAPDAAWVKSSYSNDSGGSCVEVAPVFHGIGVRDSKDPQGPALVIPSASWNAFIDCVRTGALDHGLVDV